MTILVTAGIVLLICGVVAALIGLVRYSDFLARLQVVDPSSVESLAMDYTENWSNKNFAICLFFWRKEYLSSSDNTVRTLGHTVRQTQLLAVLLVILGVIVSAFAK